MIPKLKNRQSQNRLDIVNFKPQPMAMPGKQKAKVIKAKKGGR